MTKKLTSILSAAIVTALSCGTHAATLNTTDFGVSYFVDSGINEAGEILLRTPSASASVQTEFNGITAFADIAASVETGKLQARSGIDSSTGSSSSTSASVTIKDTITVDASALTFSDIFNLTFTSRLTGFLNGNSVVRFVMRADNRLTLGGQDVRFDGSWLGSTSTRGSFVDYRDQTVRFISNGGGGAIDAETGVVSVSMNLRGGRIYETKLTATLSTTGSADFFNTAALGIDTSVPWTSASGVFLSDTGIETNPIPLPAAAWLLLASLGALRLLRRNDGVD